MKSVIKSSKSSYSLFLICATAIACFTILTGCQTTGSSGSAGIAPDSTFQVGSVGEAPGVAVYGGEMNIKEATAAAVLDVVRGHGFVVVPSGSAARYEVRSMWRVSTGVDDQVAAAAAANPDSVYVDAYTRNATLMVRVVDLQNNGETVYEGSSWPTDTHLLGPAMVRSAVETALANL